MLGESGQVIQATSLSEVIRSDALTFHPILKIDLIAIKPWKKRCFFVLGDFFVAAE